MSKIKLDPENTRLHNQQNKDSINKSLKELKAGRSILIDNEDYVIAGNGVFEQAKELGIKIKVIESDGTELIVVKRTDLNYKDKNRRQLAIADNATGETSEWNFEELTEDEIQEWNIEVPEDEEEVLEAEEDDFDVTPPEVPLTVLGDLYEIGEHRLLCGDSTCADTVHTLMNGQKADMVFTDPPYLMDFDGGMTTNPDGNWIKSFNSKHDSIKNDKLDKSKEADFLDSINSIIKLFCKGSFYICFYRLKLGDFFASLDRVGMKTRTLITWNKGNHTMSNSDYWSKCEHIFYGWIEEHNFYNKSDYDIWDIARTQKNDLHPTMKPIKLCEKAISNSSKLNDIVMDLFLGSGSTMVAAHQLKRKCYGMELDPKYCDVIVRRMIELDNSLTVLRNGKDETIKWKN